MTIVNWYKPIDPWMKDKVLSMLSETNTFPDNLNRIIAALAFIVIDRVPTATLAEVENLCEDVEKTGTLNTLAQNTSQVIFNMEPPDSYILNKNQFMLLAAREAEKLAMQKLHAIVGFYPFSDALGDLKKLTDEIK